MPNVSSLNPLGRKGKLPSYYMLPPRKPSIPVTIKRTQPGDRIRQEHSPADPRVYPTLATPAISTTTNRAVFSRGPYTSQKTGNFDPYTVFSSIVLQKKLFSDRIRSRASTVYKELRQCVLPYGLSFGMRNQKLLPTPTSLSTPIVPPCASTIAFEIARPRPLPFLTL